MVDGGYLSCNGPIILCPTSNIPININLNFERFSHPAGFLDSFHQNWWPDNLHFDGIPAFDGENMLTKNLKFTKIPKTKCENVTVPVFVKSGDTNQELRNLIRQIFNYQKDDTMKIFFILC